MRRSRVSSCSSEKSSDRQLKRGSWTPEEDMLLVKYIEANGVGHWNSVSGKAGLMRSGKSCRLRWMNYLRPEIKRGGISPDEEELIIRLHNLLGNRWALIAGRVPGRTDNDIKNYWNIHLSKKLAVKGTSDSKPHESVIIEQSTKGQPISDRHDSNKGARESGKINDSMDNGRIIVSGNLNSPQLIVNSPKEFKRDDCDIYSKDLFPDPSPTMELNFISNSTIMTWSPSLECSMACNDSKFNYMPDYSDNKGTWNSTDENVTELQYSTGKNISPSANDQVMSDGLTTIAVCVQTTGFELQQNPYNNCSNIEVEDTNRRSDSILSPWLDSLPWLDSSNEMDLLFL
eukprot:Gb_34386 [translate_table: standard]